MNGRRLLTALLGVEQGWTWLYTAGMPVERSSRRREEIRSDAWDYGRWALRSGREGFNDLSAVGHAAARFVFGVPSDVGWRLSCGRGGVSREAATEGALAALIVIGLAVALPLAPVILAGQYVHSTEEESGTVVFALYVVIMTLVFGGLGVLAMERFPVAGGVLVLIGCAGIAIAVWFIPFASSLCLVGAGATAFAMVRSRARADERGD